MDQKAYGDDGGLTIVKCLKLWANHHLSSQIISCACGKNYPGRRLDWQAGQKNELRSLKRRRIILPQWLGQG